MDGPCSPGVAPRVGSGLPSPPVTAINPSSASTVGAAAWPPSRRLLRRVDIRAAYDHGMRRSSPHFTLFAVPSAGLAPRFGITVSSKLGGAVERNRIRRRTREMLRRYCVNQAPGTGFDVVINPRPSVAHADFQLLAGELAELVRRATVKS